MEISPHPSHLIKDKDSKDSCCYFLKCGSYLLFLVLVYSLWGKFLIQIIPKLSLMFLLLHKKKISKQKSKAPQFCYNPSDESQFLQSLFCCDSLFYLCVIFYRPFNLPIGL